MKPLFKRRMLAVGAASAAALMALTGCFGGSSSPSTGAGGDDRIALAMLQPPRSGLSPFSDDATKLSRWATIETLVVLDEEGLAQPALATDWEQVDDNTWHFTIRDGVLFHDGTEMTPEAVANSLQQALDATPPPRVLDGFSMTVTVIDGGVIELVTDTPDPILPQRLSSPQLGILSEAAYQEDGTVTPLGTGTGPFELTDIGGTSTATLERFDDYWGEPALASGVDVAYVNDGAARGAALRTGEAQIVEAVPISQLALLEEDQLHEVAMPRTNSLYFNTDSGVFSDPELRAAAAAAIDRQAIVDRVYEGYADAAQGIFGPAVTWAADLRGDVAPTAEPTDVNGVKVTLATYTDRAELPEVAVVVEQQLEAAGFIVEQDVREYANFESDAMGGGFDLVIASRATQLETGDPVSYLQSDYTCSGTGFVFAQLCSDRVDELVKIAAAAEPGEERQQAIMDVEEAILQEGAILPLLHEFVFQGEADGVQGAVRDPIERLLITNMTTVEG